MRFSTVYAIYLARFNQILHFSGDKRALWADNMNSEYAKHVDKRRSRKFEGNGGEVETSPLESAENHVRASTGSGGKGNEGGKEFAIAFSSLLEWAENHGLIRPHTDFPFLDRCPDGYGDEHEAWFDVISSLWFKATYPNRFGLAWAREDSATAREYLSRLVLQNRYFGDDIQLVALINTNQRLRILTSQPHISGEAAPVRGNSRMASELGFCANMRQ